MQDFFLRVRYPDPTGSERSLAANVPTFGLQPGLEMEDPLPPRKVQDWSSVANFYFYFYSIEKPNFTICRVNGLNQLVAYHK